MRRMPIRPERLCPAGRLVNRPPQPFGSSARRHPSGLVRLSALFVLGTLFLAAPARPAWACSCAMPGGPDEAMHSAQAVFTGTVTGVNTTSRVDFFALVREWLRLSPALYGLPDQVRVTLAVTGSWKGVTSTPVAVATGFGGGDCGYSFAAGQSYLIYAYGSGDGLTTHICTRTAEISQAAGDLAYLQTQPTLAVSPARAPVVWLCAAGGAGAALLLGLAGAAVVVMRRRSAAKSSK